MRFPARSHHAFRGGWLALVLALAALLPGRLGAQQYPPVIDFEHALNGFFHDSSGLITFSEARVIFAPEGQFNGQVAVLDSANNIVGAFNFYPDYRVRNGVYAEVGVNGQADVTLTKPGVYTIVWVVDKKPVTRLPVRLEEVRAGNDPFKPGKSFRFDGYWRTLGFLTRVGDPGDTPELHYWLGGKDLAKGQRSGRADVALYRDGKLVAHSKRQVPGIIRPGHYEPTRVKLFHPHDVKQEPNAKFFELADWLVDGRYEIRVTRQADGKQIRSLDFRVADGAFVPHPRTEFGYQPQTDYIAPRVQTKGATSLDLEEAVWLMDLK